jgi:uncharacterized phage-associated protein
MGREPSHSHPAVENLRLQIGIDFFRPDSSGLPKVNVNWLADEAVATITSEQHARDDRPDSEARRGNLGEEVEVATFPGTSAQEVANYLIWGAHDSGSFISNLKLQKLLYYAQAWHLALFDKKLFPERFQAWIHGPAIPSVYRTYKKYGWTNIDEETKRPDFDEETKAFLEELLDEYGSLDARRLEWLTHREDPWLMARNDAPSDETCTTWIDEDLMKSYFKARLAS